MCHDLRSDEKKRKCDHRNIDTDKAERLGKGCHV